MVCTDPSDRSAEAPSHFVTESISRHLMVIHTYPYIHTNGRVCITTLLIIVFNAAPVR